MPWSSRRFSSASCWRSQPIALGICRGALVAARTRGGRRCSQNPGSRTSRQRRAMGRRLGRGCPCHWCSAPSSSPPCCWRSSRAGWSRTPPCLPWRRMRSRRNGPLRWWARGAQRCSGARARGWSSERRRRTSSHAARSASGGFWRFSRGRCSCALTSWRWRVSWRPTAGLAVARASTHGCCCSRCAWRALFPRFSWEAAACSRWIRGPGPVNAILPMTTPRAAVASSRPFRSLPRPRVLRGVRLPWVRRWVLRLGMRGWGGLSWRGTRTRASSTSLPSGGSIRF
mmetsp:Transcript_23210/g.58879  ORF Transcript_23210/g.58879 Transcript_23210/m.58879 type:complete len:285 (-) Transcript_23210:1270-2124(-)